MGSGLTKNNDWIVIKSNEKINNHINVYDHITDV